MGIKDFLKVCPPDRIVDFKAMAGKTVAVDSSIELYRMAGTQNSSDLTNANGEPTHHIKAILSNVIRMQKVGLKSIWCIDSCEPLAEKAKTLEDRRLAREAAVKQVQALRDELEKLEEAAKKLSKEELAIVDPNFEKTLEQKRNTLHIADGRVMKPGQLKKLNQDMIKILKGLGIPYCVAPADIEAEQLGAYLCKLKVADGVQTTDTDAMAFGAPWMMKKVPKKSGKYELITRETCLKDLTEDEFIQVCVALGCDYAPKASGVGPKTVVNAVKKKKITWSPEQLRAIQIFKNELKFTPKIVRPVLTAESLDNLKTWLVKDQGFNEEILVKQLEPFYQNLKTK